MIALDNAATAVGVAGFEGGGVVDHDVDPAACGSGLVDDGAAEFMVGHIDLPKDRLAAFGFDQAEGFLAMSRGRAMEWQ